MRDFIRVPYSSQSDLEREGLAMETTLMIQAAQRREGGMPRRHIWWISSRLLELLLSTPDS